MALRVRASRNGQANELQRRGQDEADELYDAGVRLFTLGFQGPDWDFELVRSWLTWRDAKNGA